MNILYCDRFMPESMNSIRIYELFNNLSKLGHNVVFLDRRSSILRQASGAASRPSLLKRMRARVLSSWLYKMFRGEILIGWLLLHEARLFISAFLLIARRRKAIDVIYRDHNMVNSEYLLSRLFRIPYVKGVNGLVADEARIAKQGDRLSLGIMDVVEKCSMGRASRIVVVTSGLRDVIRDEYHVPADKITVIWNGANTDLFRPIDAGKAREELGLDTVGDYVCFSGSLVAWQGLEHLVKSAPLVLSQYPAARFLIVGDGAMKKELVLLTQKDGIGENFLFTGFVPYEKVPWYVNASNICVAPFVAARNERIGLSPLKLCEYMACEKPVVTSRINGLEVVETEEAGILVAPESPKDLADAILRLLGDPELGKRMGQNGRRFVVENRSWESAVKSHSAVFQQAIQEHQSGRGIS